MDIQRAALVLIFISYSCGPAKLLLPHPGAEAEIHQHFYVCFLAYVYVGFCSNIQLTFRLFVGACYVQRGICFLEMDRTEVCSLSHLKRTAPGFVWKQTKPPLQGGLGQLIWCAPK